MYFDGQEIVDLFFKSLHLSKLYIFLFNLVFNLELWASFSFYNVMVGFYFICVYFNLIGDYFIYFLLFLMKLPAPTVYSWHPLLLFLQQVFPESANLTVLQKWLCLYKNRTLFFAFIQRNNILKNWPPVLIFLITKINKNRTVEGHFHKTWRT